MSNIVERLRSPANVFYEYAADNGAFLREAADEITSLRAENKRMREALKIFVSKEPIQLTYNGRAFVQTVIVFESDLVMARAALEGVTEPEIQS